MGAVLKKTTKTEKQSNDREESIDFLDHKQITIERLNEQTVALIVNKWCNRITDDLLKLIVSNIEFDICAYYVTHYVSEYAGYDVLLGIFQSYELAAKGKQKYIEMEHGKNRYFCSMTQTKEQGTLDKVVSINRTDCIVEHHDTIYAICYKGGAMGQRWRSVYCFCDKRVFGWIRKEATKYKADYVRGSGLSGYIVYDKLTVNKLRFRNKDAYGECPDGGLNLCQKILDDHLWTKLKKEESGFGRPEWLIHQEMWEEQNKANT